MGCGSVPVRTPDKRDRECDHLSLALIVLVPAIGRTLSA